MMMDSLDSWRDYFKTSNSDVVEIIEKAIMVAGVDCPEKLRASRDRLVEFLFSVCPVMCPRVKREAAEMVVSSDESLKSNVDDGVCCNETKFSCVRDDKVTGTNWGQQANGELEALTHVIDEEKRVSEVLTIKGVLRNFEVFADEPEPVLFEALRSLQLMELNFAMLKETEIGKAVNLLRKHESKRIRHLVRELIGGWRLVVDEYVKTAEPLSGIISSDPKNNNGDFNKSQESRKPPEPKQIIVKRQEQPVTGESDLTKETPRPQIKKHETITKTVKAVNEESGSRRPIKPNGLLNLDNETKIPTKSYMSAVQRKPAPSTEKPKVADEDAYKLKLEATKRKLHESYHKAETAKRQRTIQILQVKAIPVQGTGQNNTRGRFATNGIRQLVSRCR